MTAAIHHRSSVALQTRFESKAFADHAMSNHRELMQVEETTVKCHRDKSELIL